MELCVFVYRHRRRNCGHQRTQGIPRLYASLPISSDCGRICHYVLLSVPCHTHHPIGDSLCYLGWRRHSRDNDNRCSCVRTTPELSNNGWHSDDSYRRCYCQSMFWSGYSLITMAGMKIIMPDYLCYDDYIFMSLQLN